jgi:hypothetical protein
MAQKPDVSPRRRRSFIAARRRALARLGKGCDLQWTPPGSRDSLYDRTDRRPVSESPRVDRCRFPGQSRPLACASTSNRNFLTSPIGAGAREGMVEQCSSLSFDAEHG